MIIPILKGIQTLYRSSNNLKSVIPGGIHYERVFQQASFPYATISIAPVSRERTSGKTRIEVYEINIRVFSGPTAVDVEAIERVLESLDRSPLPPLLSIPRHRVIDFRLSQPAVIDEDDDTRLSQDVLIINQTFELVVQYA